MLRTLKDLFDAIVSPNPAGGPAGGPHSLELATAVLLVEVMRAEPEMGAGERMAVVAALQRKFTLPQDELDRLVELAGEVARTSSDFHQFTSVINDRFGHPEKIRIVEAMWEVAYADGHLDAHENHLIARVAGLLHVTHGEYIGAKLRAREAAGV
ncbi:MAG: TerB family tellurite resistance protein [Comamonadaceae bacterium]|nr:MAG: TerB family tellurite resistance protein [Comamonadaceae bacterium]